MTISSALGSSVPLAIPAGVAGWRLLQTKAPADFTSFSKDPVLKSDIAYLRAKLPSKLTAKDMLADPRLQRIVLSAYRLDAQIGMTGLMEKVLNSDTSKTNSVARRMSNSLYTQVAADLNYGGLAVPAIPAVPSSAKVTVEGLQPGATIASFSGSFGGVSVRDVDTAGATNRSQMAALLQAAFRRADGNRSDISVTVFGTNLVFNDAKGRGAAQNLVFGSASGVTASLLPTASTMASISGPSMAKVVVANLRPGQTIGNFSGTFGGVSLTAIDTTSATTPAQLAAGLQAAFRKADGGRADISVTAYGNQITFSDAKSRGGAANFSFDMVGSAATATLTETTTAGGTLAPAILPAPSSAKATVEAFVAGQTVDSFSGTFGGVTLKSVPTGSARNWTELAITLQKAFRAADGGRADISVTASGHTLTFTDSQGSGGAKNFSFATSGGASAVFNETTGDSVAPAADVQATFSVNGLRVDQTIGAIAGSFAGVTIAPLDVSGAVTEVQLAAALQAAFRAADGNRSDISVTADGSALLFKDAKKRGGATSFSVGGGGGPTATVVETAAGSPPVTAKGGPKVTDPSFVEQLVSRYTQAKFEQSVGAVSDTLRKALYAKTMLPKATNWYSVIADRNQAAVVETVLNLPDSFVKVDVDRQVSILKSKMNISDFQNPAKLNKFLDQFVAKSSVGETAAVNDPTGMLQLFQPLNLGTTDDSISGASSAALFALL